jgi:DNA replicative helicase MCM subunit Mcm2 (Cdc46/Mcm family)
LILPDLGKRLKSLGSIDTHKVKVAIRRFLTILIDTGARAKKKNGFPVFSTTIEANYIQRKGGNINADISEEDRKLIVRMSQDPQVIPERSLSPSL